MYAYFNYVHIIYILLPFLLTIAFYLAFKDASKRAQWILLVVLWAFTVGILITDLVRGYLTGGYLGMLRVLPLFACDINSFILPIILFSKKQHPVVEKYVAYFTLTGPMFTLLSPLANASGLMFYSYSVWSTFLGHGTYITISILYFAFFRPKISSRKPWQMWLMIHGLMLGVHLINLLLIHTGLYPEANYFFTIDGFPLFAAWRAMVSLGYHIPYVHSFIFMTVGYTAMTIFFYFVHKITETEIFAKFVHAMKETWGKGVAKMKGLFGKKTPQTVPSVADQTPIVAETDTAQEEGKDVTDESSE